MEEQILPCVSSGKYEGRPVTELMADTDYINFLKSNKWFNANNKNWAPIYNIIVNQTLSPNKDGKTPEHNKLQNSFLEKENQLKLISNVFKINSTDGFMNMLNDEDIIRCFGKQTLPGFINNLDKTTVKFEDKFNWDLVVQYNDRQELIIKSILETELADKIKYKEQYVIDEKERHNNNLLLFDQLIERTSLFEQNVKKECDAKLNEYCEKMKEYENELKSYFELKPQNDKDIQNYKCNLHTFDNKKLCMVNQKSDLICKELGIDYNTYIHWNKKSDKDNTHSSEEKNKLTKMVEFKLKPFIEEFESTNVKPKHVSPIKMPTEPNKPADDAIRHSMYTEEKEIHELLNRCRVLTPTTSGYSTESSIKNGGTKYHDVSSFFGYKTTKINKTNKTNETYEWEKYVNEWKISYLTEYEKEYEKTFEKYYEKCRLQFYREIIKKYCNSYVHIEKCGEQYNLSIDICNYSNRKLYCELKPTLGEDYPCVLRKMNAQIELTKNDRTNITVPTYMSKDKERIEQHYKEVIQSREQYRTYALIIGSFTPINTTKDTLITIFNQSKIKVIFIDELFPALSNSASVSNQVSHELIEQNKLLTDTLSLTQNKLLQAENKIKQLEEEIQSLKTPKQSKSIKCYFDKK